jgi:hypothetical protein
LCESYCELSCSSSDLFLDTGEWLNVKLCVIWGLCLAKLAKILLSAGLLQQHQPWKYFVETEAKELGKKDITIPHLWLGLATSTPTTTQSV